jgi:hypothetical protein
MRNTKDMFLGLFGVAPAVARRRVITSFHMGAKVDYAGFDPEASLMFFSCEMEP